MLGLTIACHEATEPLLVVNAPCADGPAFDPIALTGCLAQTGIVPRQQADSATVVIRRAIALRDSLLALSDTVSMRRAGYLTKAMQTLSDLHRRGALATIDDSARVNRIRDRIAVTIEYASGRLSPQSGRYWPAQTPGLSWHFYNSSPDAGFFFQPVETIQSVLWITPNPSTNLDTLTSRGEAIWRYAVWHTATTGARFPRWEYYLDYSLYGFTMDGPWVSGMAQGNALMLFSELYRRTQSPLWRDRAVDTFRSFTTTWDDGGVLLPPDSPDDQSIWWEEAHPSLRIWNGSVQALIAVGVYAHALDDGYVETLYQRGITTLVQRTTVGSVYDTGAWTRYCQYGPMNSQFYHNFQIQLADRLAAQSGSTNIKRIADRWRSYPVPPGTRP
jgi:hypothetical protein